MTFVPGVGETGPLTGPLVLGYMLGCILVGVLIMQVYSYYINFPNDRPWIKWMVGVLFSLEMIFTLFTLINAWASFGTGWGDVNSLKFQHWSLVPIAPLSGIIASIVQFFFAYRIFKLMYVVWLPAIIASISVLQCVMVFYVGITNAVRGRSFVTFYELSTFITVWLAGDAVCDILITISTVAILVRAARKCHFRNMDTTLRRLIRLSVETGLITASGATVELILWQAEEFLNYHYIFFLVLGKLYSNALMATLNSRTDIHAEEGNIHMDMGGRNHLTFYRDTSGLSESATMTMQFMRDIGRSLDVQQDPTPLGPFRHEDHKSINSSNERLPQTPDTLTNLNTPYAMGPLNHTSNNIPPKLRSLESGPHLTFDSDNISAAPSAASGAITNIDIENILIEVERLRMQVKALEAQRIRENLPLPSCNSQDIDHDKTGCSRDESFWQVHRTM